LFEENVVPEQAFVLEEAEHRIIPEEGTGLSDTDAMVAIKRILDRDKMWGQMTAADIARVMDEAGYCIEWLTPSSEPKRS